jgi:hypothetical protein
MNATPAKSAISAGLLCYMIRTEVENGATIAQIAEKSGLPVETIADVLNNGTPLTKAEAIAELRGTLTETTPTACQDCAESLSTECPECGGYGA